MCDTLQLIVICPWSSWSLILILVEGDDVSINSSISDQEASLSDQPMVEDDNADSGSD